MSSKFHKGDGVRYVLATMSSIFDKPYVVTRVSVLARLTGGALGRCTINPVGDPRTWEPEEHGRVRCRLAELTPWTQEQELARIEAARALAAEREREEEHEAWMDEQDPIARLEALAAWHWLDVDLSGASLEDAERIVHEALQAKADEFWEDDRDADDAWDAEDEWDTDEEQILDEE